MYTETFETLLRAIAEQHMLENPRQCPHCATIVPLLPTPTNAWTTTNTQAKIAIIKCIRDDATCRTLREDGAPGFGLKEVKEMVDAVIDTYTLHIKPEDQGTSIVVRYAYETAEGKHEYRDVVVYPVTEHRQEVQDFYMRNAPALVATPDVIKVELRCWGKTLEQMYSAE